MRKVISVHTEGSGPHDLAEAINKAVADQIRKGVTVEDFEVSAANIQANKSGVALVVLKLKELKEEVKEEVKEVKEKKGGK